MAINYRKWSGGKEIMNKKITNALVGFGFFISFTILGADMPNSIVGQQAPDFKADAILLGEQKEIALSDFEGKNKVLIFYPADFSFICPTELFAIQEKLKEFEKRNAAVIAISIDQVHSHQKWLETPNNEGASKGSPIRSHQMLQKKFPANI